MFKLPYPIASLVEYNGRKYIVETISNDLTYSIVGHSVIDSKGLGNAWRSQDELTLLSEPTPITWSIWMDVNNDQSSEYKYDQ